VAAMDGIECAAEEGYAHSDHARAISGVCVPRREVRHPIRVNS
jgi:hypothetical protein